MRSVTSTAGAPRFESSQVHSLTRPNLVSVGTIVWLSSELMFFAGLFAMYFTIRSVQSDQWPMCLKPVGAVGTACDENVNLALWHGIPAYALPFTIILVASSFTCQWGVFAAEKGDVFKLRRWFTITFVMGLIFVLGQANEYRMQVNDGNTISHTGYGSVFYLTTGFHGLHVIGGLIAFVFYLIRTTLGRFTPAQATAAIVVSYYWHFVDVVWIGLFATIYLIR
jgi:cytochrome c oxidase subunit III